MQILPLAEHSGSVPVLPTDSQISIYGSFLLDGSEFALPATAIKEVINEPTQYTSVPLSPSYLLGLFNLRGSIIPVVSLESIFNQSSMQEGYQNSGNIPDGRKIAIVEHGNLSLGILFDATGEVFNGHDVETYLFEKNEATIQDQVIAGVFKMDSGKRIIQLLDVVGTLGLDRIPQTIHNQKAFDQTIRRGKRRQCISFDIGISSCALDISAIREIVNIGAIENTVLAGSLCLGAIDLRGQTVPIVNFSLLLGYEDSTSHDIEESDSHRIVIMKVEEHLFGLLVSRIGNIISYFDDELMPFPALGDSKTELFNGCITHTDNSDHTIVLNHKEIFSNDEIKSITKGHSSLFKDPEEKKVCEKQGGKNLKTLITFSLDILYGLDIIEVSEVIDYPGNLISTPSMATHICGMVNLRGDLIAIIDTRKLYALEDFTDYNQCKVLIFDHSAGKYGLLVDTVDSIVPFRENQSIAVPRTAFNTSKTDMEQDIKEAVMIEKNGAKQTICILDLPCIANRVSSSDSPSELRNCA